MHKKRLKVSVCIVTYNHGRYINACLASVVGQQVGVDLEVLVGDDFSTDQTREIISRYGEKYPNLIYPIFHEKNIGGSHNYLSLISKATGDYIAHLDGDDFWLPGKLAAQVDFMLRHSECAAVYSNAAVFSHRDQLLGVFNNIQPNIFDINYLLEKGNFLNHSSVFYRANLKNEIIKINADFIDYRVHLILAKHGYIGYLNEVLVVYHHQSSTSILVNRPKVVEKLYWEAFSDVDITVVKSEALNKSISHFYLTACVNGLRKKDIKPVFYWFKQIIHNRTHLSSLSLIVNSLYIMFLDWPRKIIFKLFNIRSVQILHDR